MTKEQMIAMYDMITAVNSSHLRKVVLEVANEMPPGVLSSREALLAIAADLYDPEMPSGAIH